MKDKSNITLISIWVYAFKEDTLMKPLGMAAWHY
jgi:hypothetical protein